MTDLSLKRFYFKICAGPNAGGNPCVYINKGFEFNLFMKWRWYFDYRAALYKVQNPRHHVDILTGSVDYLPPHHQLVKRLRDKIIGKKSIITRDSNRLAIAEEQLQYEVKKRAMLLFVTDDPAYQYALTKIENFRCRLLQEKRELQELEIEFNNLKNNHETPH